MIIYLTAFAARTADTPTVDSASRGALARDGACFLRIVGDCPKFSRPQYKSWWPAAAIGIDAHDLRAGLGAGDQRLARRQAGLHQQFHLVQGGRTMRRTVPASLVQLFDILALMGHLKQLF